MRYNDFRRKTRSVTVGNLRLGARAPIAIQSMTNTPTEDAMRTLEQVRKLERAGCDIVRLSVPTEEAAYTVWKLKEAGIKMPIVADIHFDYRIALRCAELGFDKIRINPATLAMKTASERFVMFAVSAAFPFVWVSMQALLKNIFSKNTALPRPRHFVRAHSIILLCLKNLAFTIRLFPLMHQPLRI